MVADQNLALTPEFILPQNRGKEPVTDDRSVVINAIAAFKNEARTARISRIYKSRRNHDAFLNMQDWAHKTPGQSREFLPKSGQAIEVFCAFIKRAIVQFGDWFSFDLSRGSSSPLTEEQIRALVNIYLEALPDGAHDTTHIATRLADAVKLGLMDSLIVLKVHGRHMMKNEYFVERGTPIFDEQGQAQPTMPTLGKRKRQTWRLCIDLVDHKDWFPDPTGRNLYKIHQVERDLYDVARLAEEGIYDKEEVEKIVDGYNKAEYEAFKIRQMNQNYPLSPQHRKKVLLDEFWGTLLDPQGNVIKDNCVATVANRKHLIRVPEDNPFWHGEDPFVVGSILRVPLSVWHKALMDNASLLNYALNELFNLMLDGGIAAVWGIKQLRTSHLENPNDVSGGIPQGKTLSVKDTLPPGVKVLEVVSQGEVPPDSMSMYEMINSEFQQATLSNELKVGSLPPRPVKATEVVESSQSQDVVLDSLAGEIEVSVMEKMLRKSWLTILQNGDDLDPQSLVAAVGLKGAMIFSRMAPAERFAMFYHVGQFKATGLTATLARVRDFQKTMALLQAVSQSPLLLRAFIMKYSEDKVLNIILKQLNINPENIYKDEVELQNIPNIMREIIALRGLMSGAGAGTGLPGEGKGQQPQQTPGQSPQPAPSAQNTGGASVPATIAQQQNPASGMVPNA